MSKLMQETQLPNGMKIFCLRVAEVPILYDQIQEYVKYGIELREGDIVFDVGANIGLFSLWAYQKCHQNLSIYAFEPIPAVFEVLQANAQRFDSEKIKTFPLGLSEDSRNIKFAYHPNATMLSSAYPDDLSELKDQLEKATRRNLEVIFKFAAWFPLWLRSLFIKNRLNKAFQVEEVTCQLKTLSEIIKENQIEKINLLKIDVEKSEYNVLLGIEVQDWPKIEQIVVEVHNLENRLDKISNLLKEQGFSEVEVEQEPLLKGSNLFNVYAWR
ncbi:MAG: FkbM family methyltransferase [Kamptonema sp. SIO4C4]|nr:FkbM family methyltransferase [Kamptonema sp. SIO4C4]